MTITVLPTNYQNGDTYSASDVNNTNTVVNTLSASQSLIASKGDLLSGSADDTLVKTTVGSNNTVLFADSTQTGGINWGTVTSAMITDGTIVAGDISNNTITSTQCKADGAATSIVSIGTALPSATSSKIHFGTTAPAGGTGAIGDIYIQY